MPACAWALAQAGDIGPVLVVRHYFVHNRLRCIACGHGSLRIFGHQRQRFQGLIRDPD